MFSRKGILIIFSGLDGAGKSTQVDHLMDDLKRGGFHPVYLWTRGGYTPAFEKLKSWVRRVSGSRALPPSGNNSKRQASFSRPWVRIPWLWLSLLDLIWIYGVQVRFWLWQGKIVICDRFLWDTLIDFRLNFPEEKVENWLTYCILSRITPKPDASILLLISVEESMRRSEVKCEPFRDDPRILALRLEQYRELAIQENWMVLDGCLPPEELSIVIKDSIHHMLELVALQAI
jgi:thymidylate kinase